MLLWLRLNQLHPYIERVQRVFMAIYGVCLVSRAVIFAVLPCENFRCLAVSYLQSVVVMSLFIVTSLPIIGYLGWRFAVRAARRVAGTSAPQSRVQADPYAEPKSEPKSEFKTEFKTEFQTEPRASKTPKTESKTVEARRAVQRLIAGELVAWSCASIFLATAFLSPATFRLECATGTCEGGRYAGTFTEPELTLTDATVASLVGAFMGISFSVGDGMREERQRLFGALFRRAQSRDVLDNRQKQVNELTL